jgi:hypothetical protein
LPSDFRILGPQVTKKEEWGRGDGRMENGKAGGGRRRRKERMKKGGEMHTQPTFLTPRERPERTGPRLRRHRDGRDEETERRTEGNWEDKGGFNGGIRRPE